MKGNTSIVFINQSIGDGQPSNLIIVLNANNLQYIVSHIFPYNVPKKKFTSVKLFIAEVGHPDC